MNNIILRIKKKNMPTLFLKYVIHEVFKNIFNYSSFSMHNKTKNQSHARFNAEYTA